MTQQSPGQAMSSAIDQAIDQPFADNWSQTVFREGLQLIAEGVTELVDSVSRW